MGTGGKGLATSQGSVETPRNWDQWVSAALLRVLGVTQRDAARASGMGLRTETDSPWPLAVEEAQERWLKGLDIRVRRGLLELLSGEPSDRLLMWNAERRFPELAPPAVKLRYSGSDGGPIPIIIGSAPRGVLREKGGSEP